MKLLSSERKKGNENKNRLRKRGKMSRAQRNRRAREKQQNSERAKKLAEKAAALQNETVNNHDEEQLILPDNPSIIILDDLHQQSGTSSNYVPHFEPSCEIQIKQEPDEDSFKWNRERHFSPPIRDSPSVLITDYHGDGRRNPEPNPLEQALLPPSNIVPSTYEPQCTVTIKEERSQDFQSSCESSLPGINHSFSATSDSSVCPTSENAGNSLKTRLDLLFKSWREKMESLTTEQRIYAEKLINDVFFEAQICRLRQDVTLTTHA